MRNATRMIGTAAAALLLIGVSPAVGSSAEWELTPGGWVSGTVDYVATIDDDAGTAVDAVLHGDFLYVTSWRSFSIYDVSDPLAPRRVSTTPLGVAVYNEQPQTNGEILLVSRDLRYAPPVPGVTPPGAAGGALEIFDVRDPEDPAHITTYESVQHDHLWACVLDCSYAYSASGTILDLRDPSSPTQVGDWSQQGPYRPQRYHHLFEVAPGIVMTGSLPMHILDARDDPTKPTRLASTEPETTVPGAGVVMPETLPARVAWPGATNGRLALVTMESPFSGPCNERVGDFQTFLTPGWRDTEKFTPADRYQIDSNGLFVDGKPPHNAVGCSAYGQDAHPGFGNNGGSVALTFFEHGMRVVDVDVKGMITERGGFLPLGGNSAQPRWLSDDLLYVIDLHRGIDILRVSGVGGNVPVIVDPPGDANFANALLIEKGPDTRPASDDRADILAIWPETPYDTIKDRDDEGRIVAVRHVPRSLRINVRTLAPARPTTGPTLLFRLPVQAEGCHFELRFHIRGPLSDAADPPEVASIQDMPPDGDIISISVGADGCMGGSLDSPEFGLSSQGDVISMEFPFAALAGTLAEDVIAPGVSMEQNGRSYFWPTRATSSLGGWILVGGPIDLAGPLPEPYVIASDVPPDIDCVETPAEPLCQD